MRIRFPIGKGRRWVALAVAFFCFVVLFAGLGLSRLKSPGGRATRIFKDTQSLDIVGMETTPNGNLLVLFKNVSSRDINGFVLAIPNNGEITVDISGGDRVISPGATEDLQIPAGSEGPDITIRAVMFAGGDVEGNQTTVAQVKQRRSALKRELKRGLALVRNAADSPDAGAAAALDRTQNTPAQYLKAIRMQAAANLLSTEFLGIKEVMKLVGINNRSHFESDFKERYGIPPAILEFVEVF